MQGYHYHERLSAQDTTFLFGETPAGHMHIASVALYELGDLSTPEGGVNFARIRRATESVLHRIPRYRQKILWTPLTRNPVWVDDPDFNLDYHMRHTSLPHPGGFEQLKRLAGRLMAQKLDRDRPLWEMWVIEGFRGNRFAIFMKIHHCMIDGVSGADLLQILMSPEPVREIPEPLPYVPRPAPSRGELLRDDLSRRAAMPGRALRTLRNLRRPSSEPTGLGAELRVRVQALGELLAKALDPPSATPINGPLGPHRRFDWLNFALEDVKALRRAAGCTVNDVVLATAAGAFREYLKLRNTALAGLNFRAAAPVSMRSAEERGKLGNRVSAWQIRLPLAVEAPADRLRAITGHTRELKESRDALGVEMMMRVAEWTPPVLLSLGAQAAGGYANTIITNVPGPQFPLYMLGARLLATFPMAPLLENMGLGIALFSYDGNLTWGFIADYNLVPDLQVFTRLVASSFRELAEAFEVRIAHPVTGEL